MLWHTAFDAIDSAAALGIVERFGTPLILVDEASLSARWEVFATSTRGARLFLPYKSNPTQYSRRYFHERGLGAEVASGPELDSALTIGISPSNLILNQPARDPLIFQRAAAMGAIVVADGLGDLQALAGHRLGTPVQTLLRIQPMPISGCPWSRFGMPLDGDALSSAACFAAAQRDLRVIGVHCHLGTNIPSGGVFYEMTAQLGQRWSALEALLGYQMRVIDLGGGFATASSCPTRQARAQWQPAAPDQILRQVNKAFVTHGLADRVELWLEPGRILVEDAAILISRVVDVRHTAVGRQVTCDSGVHQLPTAGFIRHPVARIEPTLSRAPLESALLFGGLCMETDVLAADCLLPADLAVGDLLKLGGVGSYDIALATSFIQGYCPILLRCVNGSFDRLHRWEPPHERAGPPTGDALVLAQPDPEDLGELDRIPPIRGR